MPPANVDATIILLDVGQNVSVQDKNCTSFYDKARACISRIIERKIISRPNDIVCVILMGSKGSKNNLAEQTDVFRHIEYLTATRNDNEDVLVMEPPTWDVLHKLPQKPTKYEADWFEGLIVAADAFKNNLYGKKVTNKKIVLMTNFKAPSNLGDNFDKVVAGFQSEEFEVDVIGPNLEKDETIDKDTLEAICHFVEATRGITATFEDAMRYLLFHRTKAVKPMPWNVDLSIGPSVKIPISAYGRIRDVKVIGTWNKAYKDPVTNTASTTDGVGRKKEFFRSADHAPMQTDEIVTGYCYGKTVVPFSDTDKLMLYQSGLRGLQIYGFTDANSIQWQSLAGDGVSYIFGRKGDPKAQKTLLCLVRALHESKLVGVARRVYNNGNAPTMFALFPCVDMDNFYCLSAVGLCYKDDIKGLTFPSTNLKKYEPSNEEVDAFKKLIDSMDLMTAYDCYDDQEAFPILETVNPSVQHVLDCLAFRAVNSDKPLPPPRDDIMTLFKPPETVENRSKDPLDKLVKLLNLKVVEKKAKKSRSNANNVNQKNPSTVNSSDTVNAGTSHSNIADIRITLSDDEDIVTNIGTVNPVGDFRKLQSSGKSLASLYDELSSVVENLVYLNFNEDYGKAIDTLRVFRDESLKDDPTKYNDWLKSFKTALAERGKGVFLEILRKDNLDLILKEENDLSNITQSELEDNNPLYQIDTVPDSTQLKIQSDVYAMFDDM